MSTENNLNSIFCNNCSIKFKLTLKFFLSECGHIYCENCVSDQTFSTTDKFSCKICAKFVDLMEFSVAMQDFNTQMYFWSEENLFEKVLKILNFQRMHQTLYQSFLWKKYNFAKKEFVRYYNENKKLKNEVDNLRQILNSSGYNNVPFPKRSQSNTSITSGNNKLLDRSRFSSMTLTPGLSASANQFPTTNQSFLTNDFREEPASASSVSRNNPFRRQDVDESNYLDKFQKNNSSN